MTTWPVGAGRRLVIHESHYSNGRGGEGFWVGCVGPRQPTESDFVRSSKIYRLKLGEYLQRVPAASLRVARRAFPLSH